MHDSAENSRRLILRIVYVMMYEWVQELSSG